MPRLDFKRCGYGGCSIRIKVEDNYCDKHKGLRNAEADMRRGGTDPFYKTGNWQRARAYVLTRNPLCAMCGAIARVVDHITPITQGGSKFELTNLQPLCFHCHSVKTRKDQANVT